MKIGKGRRYKNDADHETNVSFRIPNRGCRLNARSELRRCSASGFRRDQDAALPCAACPTDRVVQPCRELGEATLHRTPRVAWPSAAVPGSPVKAAAVGISPPGGVVMKTGIFVLLAGLFV